MSLPPIGTESPPLSHEDQYLDCDIEIVVKKVMLAYDLPDSVPGRLAAHMIIICIAYSILNAVSVSSPLDSKHEDHSHDVQHPSYS